MSLPKTAYAWTPRLRAAAVAARLGRACASTVAVGVGGLVAACSGGTETTQPSPTPTVAVAASVTLLSMPQGQSSQVTLTLARGGGFGGAVVLTAEGLPTGVAGTFAPDTVPAGTTTSTLTLSAAAAAAASGPTPVVVRARGSGVTDATVSIPLTVTAAGPAPAIAITAPASVSLVQSGSTTASITLARTNFTGDVALTAENLPTGVTAAFNPSTLSGATSASTLTLAAGASAAVGTQQLTIRARATSVPDATAPVGAAVAARGPAGNVTLAYCAADPPVWVAYQSDSGPWTRVTLDADHRATIPVAGRGGVAMTYNVGTAAAPKYELNVMYALATELGRAGNAGCDASSNRSNRVDGSVAGLGATQIATITLGAGSQSVFGAPGPFEIASVPTGTLSLLATRALSGTGAGPISVPDAIIFRRGVSVPAAGPLPVLDFGSSEAFAPATGTLTLANLAPDTATVGVSLYSDVFSNGALLGFPGRFTGDTTRYGGVPDARLRSGELHLALVLAKGTNVTRTVYSYFRSVRDRTVTLGAKVGTPTFTVTSPAPYVMPRVQLASQADYRSYVGAQLTQSDRIVSLGATQGYFGGTPDTWDLTFPDLSAVAGFDLTWGLHAGGAWYDVSAYGGDAGPLSGGAASDGSTVRVGDRLGTAFGVSNVAMSRARQLPGHASSALRRDLRRP